MCDYKDLENNLNKSAVHLLSMIKQDYGASLSSSKRRLLEEMIQTKNVILDMDLQENKILIYPDQEIPFGEYCLRNKNDFEINFLLEKLFAIFITLSFSEEEHLTDSSIQKQIQSFLQAGFIQYFTLEFCRKNGLLTPTIKNSLALEFIAFLENAFPGFSSLKTNVFSVEYLFFSEKFYEQTGEDIFDVYIAFMKEKEKIEVKIGR